MQEQNNYLTEEETNELQQYQYNSDLLIDNAIERIKTIDVEIARIKELGEQKIQQIKDTAELKIAKLTKKKDWDLFNLGSIIDADNNIKPTKTQKKKDFISGTIIRKFATEKMIKPKLTEKDIINKFPNYKREKIELNWEELKKTLHIKNGKAFTKETNELIDCVEVEFVPARTEIK